MCDYSQGTLVAMLMLSAPNPNGPSHRYSAHFSTSSALYIERMVTYFCLICLWAKMKFPWQESTFILKTIIENALLVTARGINVCKVPGHIDKHATIFTQFCQRLYPNWRTVFISYLYMAVLNDFVKVSTFVSKRLMPNFTWGRYVWQPRGLRRSWVTFIPAATTEIAPPVFFFWINRSSTQKYILQNR